MCMNTCWTILVNKLTYFICPRYSGGGIKFYPCPSLQFSFSDVSLPLPNVMNLNTMLIATQQRSSLNLGVITFTVLDLCFFLRKW